MQHMQPVTFTKLSIKKMRAYLYMKDAECGTIRKTRHRVKMMIHRKHNRFFLKRKLATSESKFRDAHEKLLHKSSLIIVK